MDVFFYDLKIIVIAAAVMGFLLQHELGIAKDDAKGIVDLMGYPCGELS